MGHRSFGGKTSESDPSNTSSAPPKLGSDDMPELNGVREVTQEQRDQVEEARRHVRDQVSNKMGEMLLRGYTMLNAYCELCSGILMEDRQGIRHCVTCDLVNAQLGPKPTNTSRLLAEIPLDASDDIQDALTVAGISAARNEESAAQAAGDSVEFATSKLRALGEEGLKELKNMEIPRLSKKSSLNMDTLVTNKRKPALTTRYAPPSCNPAVTNALKAVEEKLGWCAERLTQTDDIEEIVMLHKAIKSGIEIVYSFSAL